MQGQTRDLTNAHRMITKPMLALTAGQKTKVYPHRLLDPGLTDVHGQRCRQIRWPILPSRKRWQCVLGINRSHTNAEGTEAVAWAGPSLPKPCRRCGLILRVGGFMHPQQLNDGI